MGIRWIKQQFAAIWTGGFGTRARMLDDYMAPRQSATSWHRNYVHVALK